MKLDKKATKQAIFDKVDSSIGMTIRKDIFDSRITTAEDYREACKFVGIKPIYKLNNKTL